MTDLFTATEPAPSDRAITADLMARLERHYIKPGQDLAGGVFVPEVGQNGQWGRGRRCDAIYVGFTSTSGRLLVGHEVKASRGDWLTELKSPGKADTWADQCHEWWLVTAPGIVADGELPDGWGHMVPGKSRTRMKVLKPARRHPDRQPSWDAVRSIIARQDTLRAQAITDGVTKAVQKRQAEMNADVERLVESRMRDQPDAVGLKRRLDRIEAALGGRLVDDGRQVFWYPRDDGRDTPGEFTADTLSDLASLLRSHATLQVAAGDLVGRYATDSISGIRRALEELERARAAVMKSLPKAGAA